MRVLPKTFQDAISVTRRLKIRYLWIDSLYATTFETLRLPSSPS
jgi:hypothetical protein